MTAPRLIIPEGGDSLKTGDINTISSILQSGGVLLFPTESFYALGADPRDGRGVSKVFELKDRPLSEPLLVLIDAAKRAALFAESVPPPYRPLIEHFWPGPLTLLFPGRPGLPAGILSAGGGVALRLPGDRLCRAVVAAAGGALTGTSANVSGAPPAADHRRVALAQGRGVDAVVDGGTLRGGEVSTIVGMRGASPVVLRRGAVGEDEIAEIISG